MDTAPSAIAIPLRQPRIDATVRERTGLVDATPGGETSTDGGADAVYSSPPPPSVSTPASGAGTDEPVGSVLSLNAEELFDAQDVC